MDESQRKSLDLIKRYFYDPVAFCTDILKVELDDWQEEAFSKLLDSHHLTIRSGSGVGKTFWMSNATLWFLFTRPNSKVPTTAPSQHQLNDVLWGEHFQRISNSPVLGKLMMWTQTRIGVRGYEPTWYAVARTAQVRPGSNVAEGLSGFHAEKYLMFVLDEASGISDIVFPAVEGALTGGEAYCVMCSNPTRNNGYFADTFNNPALRGMYSNMHVSCYDSKRVSKRYIDMMEARYGKDHPVFKIKVLGEFPDTDIAFLIPPAFVEQMLNNSPADTKGFPIEFGIDIGRTGAASVLCARQGSNIIRWSEKHKPGSITDTNDNIKWASEHILDLDPSEVKIDAIYNPGIYDGLKALWGDRIVPVIGNASPAEKFKERYLNLRAQGYWELRNLIPSLYCQKWPERLITEISDIRTKPANKLRIESKEDMRARALKSPDYADALYMAFLNADDCYHIRRINYDFPTLIAPSVDELKKPSIRDLSLSNGFVMSKFRRAFHGRSN